MSFPNLKENEIKIKIGENWEDRIGVFFSKDRIIDRIGDSGSYSSRIPVKPDPKDSQTTAGGVYRKKKGNPKSSEG